jgi:hypothetical protein
MASSSAEPAPPATTQDTQPIPEFDVPEVNIEAESLEVGVCSDLSRGESEIASLGPACTTPRFDAS